MKREWIDKIFKQSATDFVGVALDVFRFQYENNTLYHSYVDALKINPAAVNAIEQIPFLPIRFFKTAKITTTEFTPALIFESSGTTGMKNSQHLIKEPLLYEESFIRCFEHFYGPLENVAIVGLLPNYLEKGNSSLVYMVQKMIEKSSHPQSGFYLYERKKLGDTLQSLEAQGQKTLLFGVTYALLDFAEEFPMKLKHTTIIETGGMKGRRKEMIREEVHQLLTSAFGVPSIHSEYGMTELLSQGWSKGKGIFQHPHWMKILIRDEEDPLTIYPTTDKTIKGAINVIDLANIYSCSFLATDDAGKLNSDGSFEVLGRLDNADIRGCSLLYL